MKKVFAICFLFVFLLYGCSTEANKNTVGVVDGSIQSTSVKLPDGRSVICVALEAGYGASLSCDWSNAR